ncbi:hypothetical protein DL98DRAFT_654040 [Cadophora sp. DSE1049]|nr:hypothetical protein DL98DRAFT_654040 [Cadophora sp. DSE1049]
MNQSIQFLKPDGTPSRALYCQSENPLEWHEVIPPSRKKTLKALILDHRSWEALRHGELNDLFILLPSLQEIILPIYDWGDMDTYIGTMQFTKLNKDRIVYISGALNIPTLDKNEYDSWSEWKRDLEAVGEEIITPGMLEKEIGEIVKASLVSTAMEGNLIDMDPREVKITVCGMRRVEG